MMKKLSQKNQLTSKLTRLVRNKAKISIETCMIITVNYFASLLDKYFLKFKNKSYLEG